MGKYLLGVVLVAAGMAATGYLMQPKREEAPAPGGSGGVLNLHYEENVRAAEFMNGQQDPAPSK